MGAPRARRGMIILLNSSKLGFEFTLGQPSDTVLDGLRQKFIEKFGEEVYTKAAKIVIVEENFYNVIKDRYGPSLIGEHNDFLDEAIYQHLAV
tara:strand:- start:99 stop:377 length:279 start_codon:yes stop_codon:yes gene_type:complete